MTAFIVYFIHTKLLAKHKPSPYWGLLTGNPQQPQYQNHPHNRCVANRKRKKKSMWFSSCSPKQIQKHLRELGSQTHVSTLPNLVLDHSAAGNRGRLNRESHKYSLPRGWWWQVMLFILLSLGWWLLERKWFGRRGKRENESTAV